MYIEKFSKYNKQLMYICQLNIFQKKIRLISEWERIIHLQYLMIFLKQKKKKCGNVDWAGVDQILRAICTSFFLFIFSLITSAHLSALI